MFQRRRSGKHPTPKTHTQKHTHTHSHTHTSDNLKDTGIQYQKFLTVNNNMLTKCQACLRIL